MPRIHPIVLACSLGAVLVLPLSPTPATAQTPPASSGGEASQMVRAAGMPLNDGALPPGSLTVRVVEGAFTGDLPGVRVEATVDGGTSQSAITGDKGRAEFAHLPVGVRVQVSAVVNGERLTSDTFPMPAQSGVRVLLVAGGGRAGAEAGHSSESPLAPSATPAFPESQAVAAASATPGRDRADLIVVGVFAGATLLALVLILRPRWRQRGRPTARPDTEP